MSACINNLRYADDTSLMAESEEELKSLLMKVKEQWGLCGRLGWGREPRKRIAGGGGLVGRENRGRTCGMTAKGPVRAESTVSGGRPRELRGAPSDGTEQGHSGAQR